MKSLAAGLLALSCCRATAQPFPAYITGDECLFCHRAAIGPLVAGDRHLNTMTPTVDREFRLGAGERARRLRVSGYGRVDLLHSDGRSWDPDIFAAKCAGCHATAVDPATGAFASPGLDCVVCHGLTELEHSSNGRVLFGKQRRASPAETASVCGSCHLRGARWKSGPGAYPAGYVPPADLFPFIEIDFSADGIARSEDPHVTRSIVAMRDSRGPGCLDCHEVHRRNSARHRRAAPSAVCGDCHPEGRPRRELLERKKRSAVCGY